MPKRITVLCLAMLLVFVCFGAYASGGTEAAKTTKQITIDVLSTGPPAKPAVEDVVTPLVRAQTGVTANLVPHPAIEGATPAMLVSALIAANNLPHIIAQHYIPPQFESQKVLHDAGLLWTLDEPVLRKYMPTFSARMDKWGDMKIYMEQEKTIDGTHYILGHSFDVKALANFKKQYEKEPVYFLNTATTGLYLLGFRDDILKQIFPSARSAAEQEKWYVEKWNATTPMSPNPYDDVPVKNLEDLYQYLKKAKAIIDKNSLMDGAGRDKMIPGQINSNQAPQSIAYSMPTFFGKGWTEPQMYRSAGKAMYDWTAPSFKEALRWFNKCFNEGLLDPEIFIKPDTQLSEEYTRGRFAVYSNWSNFLPANEFAAKNKLGYGYRAIGAFVPITLKDAEYDQTNVPVTYFNHFTSLMVTKTVKEADLPQVLGWLDYHMSEEFDTLTSWGPSTFWTGTGKDRRFKSEYKDLENFQAYGIIGKEGVKDGYYYGVHANSPVAIDGAAQNYELWEVSHFFGAWPDAPRYVYPAKKDYGTDFNNTIKNTVIAYECARQTNFYPQTGWSWSDLNSLPVTSKILYQWFGDPGVANPMSALVRGKPADFEGTYQSQFMKYFNDLGVPQMESEYNAKWKEIFDKYVKQYWK